MRRLLLATTAITALALGTPAVFAQANGPAQDEHKQEQQKGAKPMTQAPAQKTQGKSAEMPNRSNQAHQTQAQAPTGNETQQKVQGETPTPRTQQHVQGQAQTQGSREQTQHVQGQAQTREQNQHVQGQAQAPREQGQAQGSREQNQRLQGRTQGQQQARTPNSHVQVTEQQRTQIHERLAHFRGERIEHPNFSVSVGAEIPRSVHIVALPPEIVEIVPEYSGYDYIMVGNEILIVDPGSLEIVAVIPA